MYKLDLAVLIRLIFSIVLLYFVWTSSSWSVALSLTLLFIFSEQVGNIINKLK
jgi:lipoprotein signal peptidase